MGKKIIEASKLRLKDQQSGRRYWASFLTEAGLRYTFSGYFGALLSWPNIAPENASAKASVINWIGDLLILVCCSFLYACLKLLQAAAYSYESS